MLAIPVQLAKAALNTFRSPTKFMLFVCELRTTIVLGMNPKQHSSATSPLVEFSIQSQVGVRLTVVKGNNQWPHQLPPFREAIWAELL